MKRFNCMIKILVIVGVLIMVEEINAFGQGAKIQRKTALLTVQPEVVVKGDEINAVVQPFDDKTLLRLNLTYPTGKIIEQIQVTGDSSVTSIALKIPKGCTGSLRVILEARRNGYWMPAATRNIAVMPNYWNRLTDIIKSIESIESGKSDDIALKRSTWAALAYAEDLMDRVKFADFNQSWELEQRIEELDSQAKALKQGKNPLADARGYQLRGYRSDLNGEIQPYSLYIPNGYGIDEAQKWPVVVMLHGAWSNHHLALRRVFGTTNDRGEDDVSAKRVMPDLPDVPFIVVSPNGYETMCYRGFAEDDAWRVLHEIEEMFNVDPNRIYLTGLSMGGGGTGMLGLRHPDRFAAIAPVCAFFGAFLDLDAVEKRPEFLQWPENAISTYNQAENAFQLPVKLMHGDIDPVVPVHNSHALYAKLQKLGYKSEIEVYSGVGHAAWVPAYENARIFDWFAQFERNPYPEKVVFKTADPVGGSSYWVRIDELEKIRRFGRIEAEISGTKVEIFTDNLARFSLTIPENLIPGDAVAQVIIDGKEAYNGTLGSEISFQYDNGQWKWLHQPVAQKLAPLVNGAYGVMEQRHTYVYGTNGTSEEEEEARSLAKSKSIYGDWADVQWDVIPEDALTKEIIENNHLFLFSTIEGSVFLRDHADKLPIKLNEGLIKIGDRVVEPDQAIVFLCPNPQNPSRYLLVCTATSAQSMKCLREFALNQRTLEFDTIGDFAVFNSDGKPVWGGLFDKNWQVEMTGEF